jgi:hypothetical protein
MEIPQSSADAKCAKTVCVNNIGGSADLDCARAIAQAESVLREISVKKRYGPSGRRLVKEQAERPVPDLPTISASKPDTHSHRAAAQFAVFDLLSAKAIPDRLSLDRGLDFVIHDDGAIELTEVGFWRMMRAHSAGLDVVIEVDRCGILRFPAPLSVGALPAIDERAAIDAEPERYSSPCRKLKGAPTSFQGAPGGGVLSLARSSVPDCRA